MTSIHDLVGGDYLKAADLNDQEKTVQLAGFTVETIKGDDGSERKCVAKFTDLQKGMVIGAKVNVVKLLEMFKTDDIEQWDAIVKSTPTYVTLYTEATNLGPGVRLRPAGAVANGQPMPQFSPEMMAQMMRFMQQQQGAAS